MLVKKFIVKNMNEAMTRIRYELGSDAIIISQRKIRERGLKGIFSQKLIEVTAAVNNEKKEDIKDSISAIRNILSRQENEKTGTNIRTIKETPNTNLKVNSFEDKNLKENLIKDNKNEGILKEMQEMKEMISKLSVNTQTDETPSCEALNLLIENDVDLSTIDLIKDELKGKNINEVTLDDVKASINEIIEVRESFNGKNIILVGPTGVGKTTTLAKLAGKLSLVEKKKVGLITIDTYRIGAIEQLKTYSDIMNLPFKVVFSIKDMDEAIESMKECDYILIDTTGRSSKNAMQISELRAYINKVESQDIYLVMSGCTKNKDVDTIVEGYSSLNYDSIIITKLDETSTYGGILNIINKTKKPIRFITTGQSVPDDIKVPTKVNLVNLIIGEDKVC